MDWQFSQEPIPLPKVWGAFLIDGKTSVQGWPLLEKEGMRVFGWRVESSVGDISRSCERISQPRPECDMRTNNITNGGYVVNPWLYERGCDLNLIVALIGMFLLLNSGILTQKTCLFTALNDQEECAMRGESLPLQLFCPTLWKVVKILDLGWTPPFR